MGIEPMVMLAQALRIITELDPLFLQIGKQHREANDNILWQKWTGTQDFGSLI